MKTLLCTLALAGAISAPAASTFTSQQDDAKPDCKDEEQTSCSTAGEALSGAREALRRAFSVAGRALDGSQARASQEQARQAFEHARQQQGAAHEQLAAARSLLASARVHERESHGTRQDAPEELVRRLRELERQLEELSEEMHEDAQDDSPRVRFFDPRTHEPRAPREVREPRQPRQPRQPRAPREPREPRQPREPMEPRAPRAPQGSPSPNILWFDKQGDEDHDDEDCCKTKVRARGFGRGTTVREGARDGERLRYIIERSSEDGDDEGQGLNFTVGDREVVWQSPDGRFSGAYTVQVDPDEVTVYELDGDDDEHFIYEWRNDDAQVKVKTKVSGKSKSKSKTKSKSKSKARSLYVTPHGATGDVECQTEVDVSFPHIVKVEIPDVEVRFPRGVHVQAPDVTAIGIPHGVHIELPEIAFPDDMEFPEIVHIEVPDVDCDIALPEFEFSEFEFPDIDMDAFVIPDAYEVIEVEIPEFEFPDGIPHGVIEIRVPQYDAAPAPAPAPDADAPRSSVVDAPLAPSQLNDLRAGIALASNTWPVAEADLLAELVGLMRELKTDMGQLRDDIRVLHDEIEPTVGR